MWVDWPLPPPQVAPEASGDQEDEEEAAVAHQLDLVEVATTMSTGPLRGASRQMRDVRAVTEADLLDRRIPTGLSPGRGGAAVEVPGERRAVMIMEGGEALAGTATAAMVAGGAGRGRRAGAAVVEATAEMLEDHEWNQFGPVWPSHVGT